MSKKRISLLMPDGSRRFRNLAQYIGNGSIGTLYGVNYIVDSYRPVALTEATRTRRYHNRRKKQARARTGRRS